MAIVRLSQYLDRPISYRSIHEACIDYVSMDFITATGGTVSLYKDYIIHTFTSSGTFTINSGSAPIEVLLVGGGGGGGHTSGGGGGGGEVANVTRILGVGSYSVTIGTSGAGATNGVDVAPNGGTTVFNGISALGGGGAGSDGNPGASGACGGGGTNGSTGGTGSPGYSGGNGSGVWNNKGVGGGGGGMSAAGTSGASGVAGRGGEGIASTITGSSVVYGSGGGGGASGYGGGTANVGGTNGGTGYSNAAGGAATVGTGSGGGGGGYSGTTGQWKGGDGSSGIVIVRYKQASKSNLDSPASNTKLFILPNTTSITDRSPNAWSLTSNVSFANSDIWEGYQMFYANNSGGSRYINGPTNVDMLLPAGDFTIDTILKPTGNSYGTSAVISRLFGCEGSYKNSWHWNLTTSTNGFPTGFNAVFKHGGFTSGSNWSFPFVSGELYHIAISRQAGVIRAFVNGQLLSPTLTDTGNYSTDNQYPLRCLSRDDSYSAGLTATVYMMRMVHGVSLFNDTFAPTLNIPPTLT